MDAKSSPVAREGAVIDDTLVKQEAAASQSLDKETLIEIPPHEAVKEGKESKDAKAKDEASLGNFFVRTLGLY